MQFLKLCYMKKRVLLLFAFIPLVLSASGYKANSTGIKQIGMGFVGVSIPIDASAIYFNPSMLSSLDPGIHISGGATYKRTKAVLRNKKESWSNETDNDPVVTGNIYGAYVMDNGLSFGLGVYVPYGSSVKYNDDWEGSHLVNKLSLATFYIQPTVSYQVNEWLNVGGGFIVVYGTVEQNKNLNRSTTDDKGNRSEVTVEGSATSYGYMASALLTPMEGLRLGINYRSKVQLEVTDGDATFENIHSALTNDFPKNNKFSSELPMPAELLVGISYDVVEGLTLAFDYNMIFWDEYKSLDIDFKTNTPRLADSYNPRNWQNSHTFRLGAQYAIDSMFTVRAGTLFDSSALPTDYIIPDTAVDDLIGFSLGASIQLTNSLSIDLAIARFHTNERSDRYIGYKESRSASEAPTQQPFNFDSKITAWYFSGGFSVKL